MRIGFIGSIRRTWTIFRAEPSAGEARFSSIEFGVRPITSPGPIAQSTSAAPSHDSVYRPAASPRGMSQSVVASWSARMRVGSPSAPKSTAPASATAQAAPIFCAWKGAKCSARSRKTTSPV